MSRLVSVSRLVAVLSLAAVTLGLAAPAASAAPAKKLDANLAALWTTVFETPSAQNPFGSGGAAFGCINLGGTVAPFGAQRRRIVHREARHQDLRRSILVRVQHVRGERHH